MYQETRQLVHAIRDTLASVNLSHDTANVRVVIFAPNPRAAFALERQLLHTMDASQVHLSDVPGRTQEYFVIDGVRLLISSYHARFSRD